MADREWRRDPGDPDYRYRSEFLDDRDYDRRPYRDRPNDRYDRGYDERHYSGRQEWRGSQGAGVTDRVRDWWHRNVSDDAPQYTDARPYDRDYSHGPISAGHSGWVRDRDWDDRARWNDRDWDRRIDDDRGYTDRDWRGRNYSRTTGSTAFGTTGSYGGGLQSDAYRESGRYAGRGPKSWRRSDERIREDVNEELTRHPDVDAEEIVVTVNNSEVTLTGTVSSRHEKREAEECAWRTSGVRDVQNQIRIKQGVGSVIASVFDRDKR